ncbi:hypothetical protein [Paenarthrobacter nitroguajacolicus]|uniref:hypothetical protein n=1 Tax=Paenarthrobacter nitroguajacolicus TaxID=211146 RepID=UPI0028598615|nr:hypothetical protein [Paenarthrobacter nitroguajacolicus]MDR6637090.1 hypothetical protein [Paenarthrobacter nitroguajacolicus]
MTAMDGRSGSVIPRLLEEISWESAVGYRQGGRGRENVLSAEVLLALDHLPRRSFLGAVIDAAHGADVARSLLSKTIEAATLDFLPGDLPLAPPGVRSQIDVQPDALLTTEDTFTLVEAKRIRRSAFQPHQIAREYVATLLHAGTRTPMIFLLGVEPPVHVKGRGRVSLEEAVDAELTKVLSQCGDHGLDHDWMLDKVPEVFCWISWKDFHEVICRQTAAVSTSDPSVDASIQRLAASISSAIDWHS